MADGHRGTKGRQQNSLGKFVLEMGPLVTFFLVNTKAADWGAGSLPFFASLEPQDINIMAATAAFMVATVLALTLSLAFFRTVPVMPLVSGVIVMVFGGLTLYLQDELFIKLKPTIVNLLFASTLLIGLFVFKRALLGIVFGSVMQLDDEGWRKLTFRWALFFIFLAALNEFIWRTFSTDFWVAFKVFGVMPLTVGFALLQLPLFSRQAIDEDEDDEEAEPAPTTR